MNPTTVRLEGEQGEWLEKLSAFLRLSQSEVFRAGLTLMWVKYGKQAEALAAAHEQIAAKVRQEVE
jgi:Arc/MetJ-type ribon-helix-helix transcriptional regulator